MLLLTGALLKTERSHEENQERAYVAASRRSDRGIEARIKSARMAAEIPDNVKQLANVDRLTP